MWIRITISRSPPPILTELGVPGDPWWSELPDQVGENLHQPVGIAPGGAIAAGLDHDLAGWVRRAKLADRPPDQLHEVDRLAGQGEADPICKPRAGQIEELPEHLRHAVVRRHHPGQGPQLAFVDDLLPERLRVLQQSVFEGAHEHLATTDCLRDFAPRRR